MVLLDFLLIICKIIFQWVIQEPVKIESCEMFQLARIFLYIYFKTNKWTELGRC